MFLPYTEKEGRNFVKKVTYQDEDTAQINKLSNTSTS